MNGTEVSVCDYAINCRKCGVYEKDPGASEWAVVECEGEGLIGNTIKIENKQDYLQFCEAVAYGYKIPRGEVAAF